jgi:hypothetical protein
VSGWQKSSTRTWHFFPAGPYLGLSVCLRVYRTVEPLEPEPTSILICEQCLEAMRVLIQKLEERHVE